MRWLGPRRETILFDDREDAGRQLGVLISRGETAGAGRGEPAPGQEQAAAGRPDIVLGIPRGGVPVAAAVARELGVPLDVIVAHKIGAPGQPELAIGAVAADGSLVVESWASELIGADEAWLRERAEDEMERARDREATYRAGRAAPDLSGRVVVVVDDEIATGATMRAAIMAVRKAGASRAIAASPVGAVDSVGLLRTVADDVIVLATPEPFFAVGEFYVSFSQVDDDTVAALLAAGRDGVAGR